MKLACNKKHKKWINGPPDNLPNVWRLRIKRDHATSGIRVNRRKNIPLYQYVKKSAITLIVDI